MTTTPKTPAQIAAEQAQPGHFHKGTEGRPVAGAHVPVGKPSQAPAAKPSNLPAQAVAAKQPVAAAPAVVTPPTHVSVPIETLQAIHATLSGHADTILALLPASTPEAKQAALDAATASRLKAQSTK